MSFEIDEVRSSQYEGMTGFEIEKGQGFKLIPDGKIYYGGFNVIDEENGSFTLVDQDYKESWQIEAKTLRSMKLRLNKVSLESKNTSSQALRQQFKNCMVVTRNEWNAKIEKRDLKLKEQQEAIVAWVNK